MSQALRSLLALGTLAVIIAVALLPKIIHGFDSREERVTADQLYGGFRPGSRNLEIEGLLDLEHTVEKRTTKRGATLSRRTFMPIVPPAWKPSDPVHLVYSVNAWMPFELQRLAEARTHKGVLRDVLWEGLDSAVKNRFEKMGLKIAADVKLVEAPK